VTPPSRATTAGRNYLDLRKRALADGRPVDELFQLYVLEEAWRRRQLLEDRLPELLTDALEAIARFADPAITGAATGQSRLPEASQWTTTTTV
jgi:hypothetical protein